MGDKKIYIIHLDFSHMRFLENNESVNTTVHSDYTLISANDKQLREMLPEIRKEFQNITNKYFKKYQFTNEK